jgi:DNA-binding transcriptional LysR family regulator
MYLTADLELFVHTADLGNLSRAASGLNIQPATASASLKRLERTVGYRLFERTTRSMRLTPQGEIFLEYCRSALALLTQGEVALSKGSGGLRGQLRLSAPSDFGRNILAPWLNEFQLLHPGLRIFLHCSDHHSDLFREPVDMAFRYGKLGDSTLVAQILSANRRVVVASTAYLARHGIPATPDALRQHNCLLHNLTQKPTNTWRFHMSEGEVDIEVTGDRMADDGGIVRQWAIAGCGIAYKSLIDVRADLATGRLTELLAHHTGADWPLSVVYPHRASISTAAKALTAFVQDRLETHLLHANAAVAT